MKREYRRVFFRSCLALDENKLNMPQRNNGSFTQAFYALSILSMIHLWGWFARRVNRNFYGCFLALSLSQNREMRCIQTQSHCFFHRYIWHMKMHFLVLRLLPSLLESCEWMLYMELCKWISFHISLKKSGSELTSWIKWFFVYGLLFGRGFFPLLLYLVISISNEIYFSSVSPSLENSSTLVHYLSTPQTRLTVALALSSFFLILLFTRGIVCMVELVLQQLHDEKKINSFWRTLRGTHTHLGFRNAFNTLLMEFQVINWFFCSNQNAF